MQPFGRNRYGPKIGGGLCPFRGGGAGSPPNTMWPGPRPTCTASFILIRSTIWPHARTSQTDRQTYRTDNGRIACIGRTVLQTVAQKLFNYSKNMNIGKQVNKKSCGDIKLKVANNNMLVSALVVIYKQYFIISVVERQSVLTLQNHNVIDVK